MSNGCPTARSDRPPHPPATKSFSMDILKKKWGLLMHGFGDLPQSGKIIMVSRKKNILGHFCRVCVTLC